MIISSASDWAACNTTEALAFARALTYLPESDTVAYIGHPWSQLCTDPAPNKEQIASYLQEYLHPLTARIPASVKYRVSVCQSPDALRHRQMFETMGITDIFCCNATPRSQYLANSGIRLWPFPQMAKIDGPTIPWSDRIFFAGLSAPSLEDWRSAKWLSLFLRHLATNDQRELVFADGSISPSALHKANKHLPFSQIPNEVKFGICNFATGTSSQEIWEFIAAGAIPVFLSSYLLPPGNPKLWQEAAIVVDNTYESIRDAIDHMEDLLFNPLLVKQKLNALGQIKKIYDQNFFISDIVEFFYNPEQFIQTRSAAYFSSSD